MLQFFQRFALLSVQFSRRLDLNFRYSYIPLVTRGGWMSFIIAGCWRRLCNQRMRVFYSSVVSL
jgi:hypothetical protein